MCEFVRCLTVGWIVRVSFLKGQEFLCTVVCPHVPLYCMYFGNPPWLERLCTLVFHVASYQLYKCTEHQLQFGCTEPNCVHCDCHKICKFVSCIFMYWMKSVELEGYHIAIPNKC
jgi:hypothetical protein